MQGSVEGPHPLQPTFAKGLRRAQMLPPQAEEDRSSDVCPRFRGKWLRREAAADDGGTWRTIDSQ